MSELLARIDARWAELTPAERVVAEHLRRHPEDAVLYNSSELARRSGVSKATVSRLLRNLGWARATDAREQLRAQRAQGVPVDPGTPAWPGTPVWPGVAGSSGASEAPGFPGAGAGASAADGVRVAFASLEAAGEARIATAIAGARRVLVLGFRNGYPVALHLREQLAQARPGVQIAPIVGQSLAEELVGLDRRDFVVVIGFRRRPAFFAALLAHLREAPARVLVIADPTGASYTAGHEFGIVCPIDGPGPFDSYDAAMALVARIASGVHRSLGESARLRALAIADLFHHLGEVEGPPG